MLNRGRHLYSAGHPSRWALAHTLVVILLSDIIWRLKITCVILLRVVYTERLSRSEVEPAITAAAVELSPAVRQHVLEQHPYLEIIADYENSRANEEPHYHEIQDSEVPESHVMSVEHRPTANTANKTVYQSLESATRDEPLTGSTPVYSQLRTNETTFGFSRMR